MKIIQWIKNLYSRWFPKKEIETIYLPAEVSKWPRYVPPLPPGSMITWPGGDFKLIGRLEAGEPLTQERLNQMMQTSTGFSDPAPTASGKATRAKRGSKTSKRKKKK